MTLSVLALRLMRNGRSSCRHSVADRYLTKSFPTCTQTKGRSVSITRNLNLPVKVGVSGKLLTLSRRTGLSSLSLLYTCSVRDEEGNVQCFVLG